MHMHEERDQKGVMTREKQGSGRARRAKGVPVYSIMIQVLECSRLTPGDDRDTGRYSTATLNPGPILDLSCRVRVR